MLDIAFSQEKCEAALRGAGLTIFARVLEASNVIDLAVLRGQTKIVVRSVERVGAADCEALRSMIAEGDFDGAFLVHSDESSPPPGDIPTYPISRIDELAALLAKESQAP
jgi:hypothetical protein